MATEWIKIEDDPPKHWREKILVCQKSQIRSQVNVVSTPITWRRLINSGWTHWQPLPKHIDEERQ